MGVSKVWYTWRFLSYLSRGRVVTPAAGPYLFKQEQRTWEHSEVSNSRLLKPCSHWGGCGHPLAWAGHSPGGEALGSGLALADFPAFYLTAESLGAFG